MTRAGDVAVRATAPINRLVAGIELRHPLAGGPIRAVNYEGDLVIGGETYVGTRFDLTLASDRARQAPQAQLAVANVGRGFSNWIESVRGGAGGTVRMFEVLVGAGGEVAAEVEWEMEMDMADIESGDFVVVKLGFDPVMGRPAVAMRFDPTTAPGLF